MNDNWTDAERLAAEVLASGSDEALRELLAELDRGAPTSRRSDPEGSSSTSRLRRWFPRRRRRSGGTRARRSLGRFSWRDSDLLNVVADLFLVLVALASIAIGMRPYAAPVADAGPTLAEVLEGIPIPEAPDGGQPSGGPEITAAERPVSAAEPISLQARGLEATIGRYHAVEDMYAERKMPCAQLRESYTEVEQAWTQYSIARGRTYRDRLPDSLVPWDEALYEAVREVDRGFPASGCNRP
ncbi:MAG: hypothetical protein M8861_05140 [marine benthic group bacterium]|nr:hypothetical protein [Gemmatimonadota bacterium]